MGRSRRPSHLTSKATYRVGVKVGVAQTTNSQYSNVTASSFPFDLIFVWAYAHQTLPKQMYRDRDYRTSCQSALLARLLFSLTSHVIHYAL